MPGHPELGRYQRTSATPRPSCRRISR
jgi:hypothetical protein